MEAFNYKKAKELIKQKGGVVKVADLIGVSKGMMYNYLSDKREYDIPLNVLNRLSNILEVSIIELINIDSEGVKSVPVPHNYRTKDRNSKDQEIESLKSRIQTLENIISGALQEKGIKRGARSG